jgi:hypothetical protein
MVDHSHAIEGIIVVILLALVTYTQYDARRQERVKEDAKRQEAYEKSL